MTPEDDASWPACLHDDGAKHWCNDVREIFLSGEDARDITPGVDICVPIIPAAEIYARVSIDPDAVVSDFAFNMNLILSQDPMDPFSSETIVNQGLWTKGEGRLVIASALNDWAEGVAEPFCNARTHNFQQEMALQAGMKSNNGAVYQKMNRWNLATEKCCVECRKTNRANGDPLIDPSTFTAANFGLGDIPTRTTGRPAGSASVLQQLQARYA